MKRRLVSIFAIATFAVVGLEPVEAEPADAAAGTPADSVIGQGGSFTLRSGGTTATSLNVANGVAVDSIRHRLFIADSGNNRVLVHQLNSDNSMPDETADFVLGQANFTAQTSGTTSTTMSNPVGLAYDATNDRLYVGDRGNVRVLEFNTTTITNGMAASFVLGQSSFTTNSTATTQSTLQNATGVALGVNDRYLFVSDQNNRRVMVFDTNALATGMNASYVIGQSSFTGTAYAVDQTTTFFPKQLTVDRLTNRLYVAEESSNRVSVWDLSALATGMNALYVIGQSSFTTGAVATSQVGLSGPQGVAVGAGRVWITDQGNHRILVFDASNTANGQSAIAVYGQSDYVSSASNNGGVSAGSLAYPNGVTFDPLTYRFWVADGGNNRVLAYNAMASGVRLTATVAPIFTFSVAGRATTCNGQSATGFQAASSATAVSLGTFSTTAVNSAAQDLSVTSNAAGGFTVFVRTTNATPTLRDATTHTIADVSGTQASPGSAPVAGTEGFGFTTSDTATPFTSNTWAKLTGTNGAAITGAANVTSKSACVGYAAAIATTTIAGAYSVPVIYTAVPSF